MPMPATNRTNGVPHPRAPIPAMTPWSDIPEALQSVNDRHINSVDKLYRMHAGASTHLTSISGGVFTLETKADGRKRPIPLQQLARNIADSWHREPELASCHACRVLVFQSAGPVGFAIPVRDHHRGGRLDRDSLTAALLEMMRRVNEADRLPAPLAAEFTFTLTPGQEAQDPLPTIPTPAT